MLQPTSTSTYLKGDDLHEDGPQLSKWRVSIKYNTILWIRLSTQNTEWNTDNLFHTHKVFKSILYSRAIKTY